uniref:Uncharacterized protein n=2 Tax=viral metagenome TaxID=1070528 RepID=A0A6H2A5Y1_9ZZZZ
MVNVVNKQRKEIIMNSETCNEQRQEKHMLLGNAISALNKELDLFLELSGKINGDSPMCGSGSEKNVKELLSLSQTLSTVPDKIREICEGLAKVRNEIRAMLF